MNTSIEKIKVKGYLRLPRELNILLFNDKLSLNEFGLLLILVMNACWDNRHNDYKKVYLSNNSIGSAVRGLNRNKVSRLKKSLIKKGFIKFVSNKNGIDIIEICRFHKFQSQIDWKMKKIEREISLNNLNQFG